MSEEERDENIIGCRFCAKRFDKTKITTNGDYGFCPHCHKVISLSAANIKIEEDNTNKLIFKRPEFFKIYELLIYLGLTYIVYFAAYKSEYGSLLTSFLTIPYICLAAGAFPYIFAKFICHVHMYRVDVYKKIIPRDLLVSIAFLLTFLLSIYFSYWIFVSPVPPIPLDIHVLLFYIRNTFFVAVMGYTLFNKLGTNPDND